MHLADFANEGLRDSLSSLCQLGCLLNTKAYMRVFSLELHAAFPPQISMNVPADLTLAAFITIAAIRAGPIPVDAGQDTVKTTTVVSVRILLPLSNLSQAKLN